MIWRKSLQLTNYRCQLALIFNNAGGQRGQLVQRRLFAWTAIVRGALALVFCFIGRHYGVKNEKQKIVALENRLQRGEIKCLDLSGRKFYERRPGKR